MGVWGFFLVLSLIWFLKFILVRFVLGSFWMVLFFCLVDWGFLLLCHYGLGVFVGVFNRTSLFRDVDYVSVTSCGVQKIV